MVGIKFKQKDVIGGFYKGHRLCKIYKGMRIVSDFCGGGGEELWEGCDDGFDYNSYPPYSVLISTNSDSPKWECHVYGDYSDYEGGSSSSGLDHGTFYVEPNWNRRLVTLTDYVNGDAIEGCHKMFDNIGNITEIIFVGEWSKPIKSIQMAFEMNPLEFLDLTQLTFSDDIWYSNCLVNVGDYTCKVTERQKEFIDTTNNHNNGPLINNFSYGSSNPNFIYCGQQYPEIEEDGCIIYSTNGDSTYRINNTAPSINAPANVKEYVDCSTKEKTITTLRNMFYVTTDTNKQNFTKIDLSHLNLSTITDKTYTFQQCFVKNYSLREVIINIPNNIIESAVDSTLGYASMQYMFAYCPIEKITSNLAFYKLLYNFCPVMGISNDNLDNIEYTITDGKKEEILLVPYTGQYNYMIVTQKASMNENVRYNDSVYSLSRQSDYDGTYHRLAVTSAILTSLDNFLQGNTNVTEFNGMRMNMSSCTSISKAFSTSTIKRIKVTNWDVSNVNNFSNCFQGSTIEEIDLSGWKPNETANVFGMFAVNDGVKRIIIPNFHAFDNMDDIFNGISADSIEYIKCPCDFYKKVKEHETHCGLNDRFDNIEWDNDCELYLPIKWSSTERNDVMRLTDKNGRTENYYYTGIDDGTDSITIDMGQILSVKDGDSISFQSFLYYSTGTTSIDFLDGDWDKVYVTSMNNAFYRSTNITHIGGLEKLNMSKCTSLNLTFGNTESLLTLDGYQNWKFPSNCDLYGTFTRTGLVDLDLSGWADNGAYMGMYFMDVNPNLESLNVCGWELSNMYFTSSDEMPKLNKIYCSDEVYQRYSQLCTRIDWDNVRHYNCEYPPYSIIYSTGLVDETNHFYINNSTTAGKYTIKNQVSDELLTFDNVTNVTSMDKFANNEDGLTEIEFVGNWDTPNMKYAGNMFSECERLAKIDGLEKLDFSKTTDMNFMFSNCLALRNIDMSKWRVNKDEEIHTMYMFQNCSIDLLDFTAFNGATISGTYMFSHANIKTIRCYQSFKDWCYEQYNKDHSFFTYIDEVEWEIVN